MIILAKEYTDFIKRIKKTINNMGKSCSVCTLMPNTDHDADDVFGFYDRYINDENIKSAHTKELYYAFIKLPEWWAVCADGINGAVYDNDVKKANELVPTLLHIRIFPVDKSDSDANLQPIDLVIGIKATIHPVSTEEMITNIARGIKNENKFFNFIRWTTGEISFFKDFVLSMNELKIDAINTGSKSSRWWTMLKRRKALAKIKNRILPDRLLPNSTIVITQETADTLRNQYG